MKITLWTLASDTDNGLFAEPHATRESAVAARELLLRADWDKWGEGDFPGSDEAMDKLSSSVGYMDSYSIEEHTLELPIEVSAELLRQELAQAVQPLVDILDRNEANLIEGQRALGHSADEVSDEELIHTFDPDSKVFATSGDIHAPIVLTYGHLRRIRAAAFLQAEAPEFPSAYTGRGFGIVKFEDRYGVECSLQDSSLATEACIWLGAHENRAHLTQEMVARLMPALCRFLTTGSIADVVKTQK